MEAIDTDIQYKELKMGNVVDVLCLSVGLLLGNQEIRQECISLVSQQNS